MPWYTDVREVLLGLGLSALDYDWYLSDLETNQFGPEFSDENQWLTGSQLDAFISGPSFQFLWGILSAVPRDCRPTVEIAPHELHHPGYLADSYETPLLKGAEFEIHCWDSTSVLLVGVSSEAAERFGRRYPDAECSPARIIGSA